MHKTKYKIEDAGLCDLKNEVINRFLWQRKAYVCDHYTSTSYHDFRSCLWCVHLSLLDSKVMAGKINCPGGEVRNKPRHLR